MALHILKIYLRLYFKLEVHVWLEVLLKIYYKSYKPFVCERNIKLFDFQHRFDLHCDFSFIEIYEVLVCVDKEIWMSEKSYGFDNIWS